MRLGTVLCFSLLALTACSNSRSNHGAPPRGGLLGFVAFESRQEMPLGVDAAEHALAIDLDGDGRIDLAALDAAGRLAVRIGQGQGTFGVAIPHTVTAGGFELLAGDVDSDGAVDLVAVARNGTAEVLLNDGNGSFALHETVAIGSEASDAALHDVDANGTLDLVVVRFGGPGVLVLDGVGDGSFVSPTVRPFDRSAEVTGLAVGDLDGDGRAEIVCCDLTRDRIAVLPGDGGGARFVTVGTQPIAAVIGDLTSDGTPEIAVGLLGDRRVDVLAAAPGGWTVVQSMNTGGKPFALAIADVDADGANDLIHTQIDRRTVSVHRAVGQALEPIAETMIATGTPVAPQLVDVDGDGQNDLFVPAFGAGAASVYLADGGRFLGGRCHSIDGVRSPEIVQIADVGLARPVVVTGSFWSNRLAVAEISDVGAESVLETAMEIDLGLPIQNIVPADLDGDSVVDFVVAVQGGVKLIRTTPPAANFRYGFEVRPGANNGLIATGDGPFEILAEDLDRDGAIDLVIAYHESDKVGLLRGSGTPFEFLPAQDLPLAGRPVGMASGDFDGDGALEVAVTRLSQATVTVLEVTSGGLAVASDTPVGPSPFQLRATDFDHDGNTDLVVSESGAAHVTLLIAQRGGGFRTLSVEAGRSPTALAVRDFDRDGNADILVASLVGADFRVLLGDGRGGVGQALVFPGVYGALTAAVGDLDGDGLEDLTIGSLVSEGVAVFRNVSRVE